MSGEEENNNRRGSEHEPYDRNEGNEHPSTEPESEEGEDESSVTSSVRADRKAVKEEPGADFRAAPEEHSGFYMMLFFNVSCFISFVFMLTASCPVAWYRAHNGDKWTLWRDNNGNTWNSNVCDQKKQMFRAMQGYTIASCVLSLISLICGILHMVGSGHFGVTLLASFLTMSTTLVSWALSVNEYHKYECIDQPVLVNKVARLNAGFALSICSFGLMFFSFLSVVYYVVSYYALEGVSRENFSLGALYSVVMTSVCTMICCVGTAFTMWENYYEEYTVKVTLWHVEVIHVEVGLSEFFGLDVYNCSTLMNYFKAGQAFAIISSVVLFITLLFTVAAVYKRLCKWIAVGFGIASFVFTLVCWAIMIGARYKKFCNNHPPTFGGPVALIPYVKPNFEGYVITEGLGMIISASCGIVASTAYLIVKG